MRKDKFTKAQLKQVCIFWQNVWQIDSVKYSGPNENDYYNFYDSDIPGEFCTDMSSKFIQFFLDFGEIPEWYLAKHDKKKYKYYTNLGPIGDKQEKYLNKYVEQVYKNHNLK